jgi:hypothetical protein
MVLCIFVCAYLPSQTVQPLSRMAKTSKADDHFAEFEAAIAAHTDTCLLRLREIHENHHTLHAVRSLSVNDADALTASPAPNGGEDHHKSRFHGKLFEKAKSVSGVKMDSSKLSSKAKFQSIVLKTIEGFTDPWEKHHIERIPAERVRSYRYSSMNKTW